MNDLLTNPIYQMSDEEYAERDRKIKAYVRIWELLMLILGIVVLALTVYIIVDAQGQPRLTHRVCYYQDGSHRDC